MLTRKRKADYDRRQQEKIEEVFPLVFDYEHRNRTKKLPVEGLGIGSMGMDANFVKHELHTTPYTETNNLYGLISFSKKARMNAHQYDTPILHKRKTEKFDGILPNNGQVEGWNADYERIENYRTLLGKKHHHYVNVKAKFYAPRILRDGDVSRGEIGMAGEQIEVIDEYDAIAEDFKVSRHEERRQGNGPPSGDSMFVHRPFDSTKKEDPIRQRMALKDSSLYL